VRPYLPWAACHGRTVTARNPDAAIASCCHDDRRLLETFAAAAAGAGASGVHVCVVAGNVEAIGFYQRLGFGTLMADEPGGVLYLGRKLLPAGARRQP
jgi:hypothetical protein